MNIKPEQLACRLAGAIALIVSTSSASADIFHVPQDFPTIPAAMAKASDYDLILVEPGIYDGFTWGNKLITIQSIMGPTVTHIVGGVIFEPTKLPLARQLDGFTVTGAKEGLYFMPGGGGHIINCMAVSNDDSGVLVINASVILENCLIADNNRVQSMGCGIYNTGGVVQGVNLTVVGNYGNHSAGICDYSVLGDSTYTNCVVWSNGPAAIDGNARFSFCNTEQWTEGFANMCKDPCFVDPYSMNFKLSPGSPCIDAGDNYAIPDYLVRDLGCSARFIDDPNTADTGRGKAPIVDMGAYEYQLECSEIMLTVKTSCPTGGQAMIHWSGATPDAPMALLFSPETKPFQVPSGQPCAGAILPLRPISPSAIPGEWLRSDKSGQGTVFGQMTAQACGRWMIILDLKNCSMSAPIRLH